MNWSRDALWAKAVLYFQRAFTETRDDPMFGFWASLGLELLVRSAVAHVSPVLLADPDPTQKNLLYALGHPIGRGVPKSLQTSSVLDLCKKLHGSFSEDDSNNCWALINRRNEELHTGSSAFAAYPTTTWLAGFYRACRILAEVQGQNLEALFGVEEARNANEILDEKRNEVKGRVEGLIAAHRRVFESRSAEEKTKAASEAAALVAQLSHQGHHACNCPACNSRASIQGKDYGNVAVTDEDGMVVVRQAMSPRKFHCSACNLKLEGYAELEVPNLGGRYSRTSTYTPAHYYGLIDPDDYPDDEYDNE